MFRPVMDEEGPSGNAIDTMVDREIHALNELDEVLDRETETEEDEENEEESSYLQDISSGDDLYLDDYTPSGRRGSESGKDPRVELMRTALAQLDSYSVSTSKYINSIMGNIKVAWGLLQQYEHSLDKVECRGLGEAQGDGPHHSSSQVFGCAVGPPSKYYIPPPYRGLGEAQGDGPHHSSSQVFGCAVGPPSKYYIPPSYRPYPQTTGSASSVLQSPSNAESDSCCEHTDTPSSPQDFTTVSSEQIQNSGEGRAVSTFTVATTTTIPEAGDGKGPVTEEERQGLQQRKPGQGTNMLTKSNSQYDSFLFWRQPLPSLDLSELEDLAVMDSKPTNSIPGKDKAFQLIIKSKLDEECELSGEYSSFNYWKPPLADIDSLLADFNVLL